MSAHEGVPGDTLAPLVTALGATLILAGVLWGPISSVVGLVLVGWGLAHWIGEVWGE